MTESVVVRYECVECGATWNPAEDRFLLVVHQDRWHEGRDTVRPVMAAVITEIPTPEVLVERAAALGRENGTAGGSWVDLSDDGSIVNGGELCLTLYCADASIWAEHYGPISGPLSGERAGGMTPDQLFSELAGEPAQEWTQEDGELRDELCRAYEDAYYDAWRDEVLRMAREQVEDGTSGQDRESYSDDQDRDSYTVSEQVESTPCSCCGIHQPMTGSRLCEPCHSCPAWNHCERVES